MRTWMVIFALVGGVGGCCSPPPNLDKDAVTVRVGSDEARAIAIEAMAHVSTNPSYVTVRRLGVGSQMVWDVFYAHPAGGRAWRVMVDPKTGKVLRKNVVPSR